MKAKKNGKSIAEVTKISVGVHRNKAFKMFPFTKMK